MSPTDQVPATPVPASAGYQPGTVPEHLAIVMDGNGRWANQRGLPRTDGHRAGEAALLRALAGAINAGVKYVSVYAFSTENWKRSIDEVRFLMGYSRNVLRRRRDLLHSWNVRIRWNGLEKRLWSSVIKELKEAEELTKNNTGTQLIMCVNYGGRAELLGAVQQLASEAAAGKIKANRITENMIGQRLALPDVPDVDLFVRTSGEQRISNFLLWQSAYAEMLFLEELWPDVTEESILSAIDVYTGRDRRFGGAIDQVGSAK
ncbi:isoprenyl transferase [Micrococcoides hystricis]|uniref:Isoprenyl transferase n=1 Tax=Micrococcoides hystricis TaxID=1572761 RepID=A0ABV6P9G9_9MICC